MEDVLSLKMFESDFKERESGRVRNYYYYLYMHEIVTI